MKVPEDIKMSSIYTIKRNICEKICFYSECSSVPLEIVLESSKLDKSLKSTIKNLTWTDMNFCDLLRICEILKIGYNDLFETEDSKYFRNFFRDKWFYLLIKNKIYDKEETIKSVADKLGFNERCLYKAFSSGNILHPLTVANLIEYLKIKPYEAAAFEKSSKEGKTVPVTQEQKPIVESITETDKEIADFSKLVMEDDSKLSNGVTVNAVADSMLKACTLYSELENIISMLDDVISKAQKMKQILKLYM